MSKCQYPADCDREATTMIQHRNPRSGMLVGAEPCCDVHALMRIDAALQASPKSVTFVRLKVAQ